MAAIIKLSQNEWVKFFLCKMAEANKADLGKMAAIIKFEWEWKIEDGFFLAKWPWIQHGRI